MPWPLEIMHEFYASLHPSIHQGLKAGGLCMLNLADMAPWCVDKGLQMAFTATNTSPITHCRLLSFQIADWQSDSTVEHSLAKPCCNCEILLTYRQSPAVQLCSRQTSLACDEVQRSAQLPFVSVLRSDIRFLSGPVHRDLWQKLASYSTLIIAMLLRCAPRAGAIGSCRPDLPHMAEAPGDIHLT